MHRSLAGEITATIEEGRGLLNVLFGEILGTGGCVMEPVAVGVSAVAPCDRVSLVLGHACRLFLLLLL